MAGPRAPGERIHQFRLRRPRHDGLKDILASQRHVEPSARHRHEQLIVVDLA